MSKGINIQSDRSCAGSGATGALVRWNRREVTRVGPTVLPVVSGPSTR
jgi:hypothetical protein